MIRTRRHEWIFVVGGVEISGFQDTPEPAQRARAAPHRRRLGYSFAALLETTGPDPIEFRGIQVMFAAGRRVFLGEGELLLRPVFVAQAEVRDA